MPLSTTITSDDDDELTQEIQEQVNEWSSNSNECFTVEMVRGDGEVLDSFNPEFTYAIFGDEEAIFGYQGLSITLSFAAHDLKPHLNIKYNKIFEAQGDVRPTDIRGALKDFLPASAFSEEQETESSVTDFRPPGEKIHEYTRNGKKYQTWCSSLADPAAKQLLTNMQILITMFIDGGSMLELEFDWTTERWKIFLVYEVDSTATGQVSPYTLVGYGTSYRIFTFPDRQKTNFGSILSSQSLDELFPPPQSKATEPSVILTPLDLPSRERLSQFLILPPYQGAGHGQDLYNTMYSHLTAPANIHEFTVEDPNEKFDDLRDFCDLLHLRTTNPDFAALRIAPSIPADRLGAHDVIPTDLIVPLAERQHIMQRTKIMPRQFDRLVEMHTLSFIPPQHRNRNRITRREKASSEHDRAYYFWRLYVKQRLYVFNRDQLAQIEHPERVEKLEAALDSVQEAYVEMIEKVERRQAESSAEKATPGVGRKKRKIVDDDDDEEEEDADEVGGGVEGKAAEVGANGNPKKARVE